MFRVVYVLVDISEHAWCKTRLAQWFSTFYMQQPILKSNLTNDPLPKISCQAYVMQLCLNNRKSQWLMLNKDSFIKFMHLAAPVRGTRVVYKSLHSTTLWKLE